MYWFRWSALVTVLVGLRYFTIILKADAINAGKPQTDCGRGSATGCDLDGGLRDYFALQMPAGAERSINARLRGALIAIVVIAASCIFALIVNGGQFSSNSHLSISIGGGLGLVMLMNAWGVVWRVQKKLIAWNRAAAENGAPMPPEAERLRRGRFFASRSRLLAFVPHALLHGRRGSLSVSEQHH